jgi:hypothetical protein
MNKKFATALSAARMIPTIRPHVRPENTAQPAPATSRPTMRSIQPQVGVLSRNG